MIYVIIYVILGILSYFGFKKLIKGNQFEYIFYSVFWPAVWMAIGVGALKDSITDKEKK
jgi:hypothetical protein